MSGEHDLDDQTHILSGRKLYIATAVLSISIITAFVDNLAISIILPDIGLEFNSTNTISWAGTSIFIGTTVFQIVSGRLTDIFGRKRILLISMGIEIVSQLAIGLCTSAIQLFVFRAIAGIGDGGVSSITMMVMSDFVAIENRGRYQAILGSCLGFASALAPFIASGFNSTGHWRGLYWFLCPLTVLNFICVWYFIPTAESTNRKITMKDLRKIDYYGLVLSAICITSALVALSGGGNTFAWDSGISIAFFTIGGVFFILFIFSQWKLSQIPTIPLRIFTNFSVALMLFQNVFFGLVWNANLYFLPLYFELLRGMSPLGASCMILPFLIAQCVASILAGQIISITKRYGYVIQIGYTASTIAQGLQMGLFGPNTNLVGICFILILQGCGVACIFQPTIVALQAHCKPIDRAVVISMRNFLRSGGGAIGISASSALMSNMLKKNIGKANLNASSATIAYIEKHIFSRPDLSGLSVEDQVKVAKAISDSFHSVFIFYFPVIGICWLTCFLIRDRGLRSPEEMSQIEEEEEEEEGKNLEYKFSDPVIHQQVVVDGEKSII